MGSAFVVVLALIGVSYRLARFLGEHESEGRRRKTAPPDPQDPRWYGSAGEQLTGQTCVDCHQRIAVENDGRFCKQCSSALHKKTCTKRHRALAHPVGGPAPYR